MMKHFQDRKTRTPEPAISGVPLLVDCTQTISLTLSRSKTGAASGVATSLLAKLCVEGKHHELLS